MRLQKHVENELKKPIEKWSKQIRILYVFIYIVWTQMEARTHLSLLEEFQKSVQSHRMHTMR